MRPTLHEWPNQTLIPPYKLWSNSKIINSNKTTVAVEDPALVGRIKNGSIEAFETAFLLYYSPLVNFANGMIHDRGLCEEQVQEVFANVWERRSYLKSELPLFPYLLASVRNKCIKVLNHNKIRDRYISETRKKFQREILQYPNDVESDEMIPLLQKAIAQLPDRCREVFELSRFQGLSHQQIEEKLGISRKTVENHITKALRILREKLLDKRLFLLAGMGVLIS